MQKENQFLAYICIFLICFGYGGWYFAELDNEALRQELVSLKYGSDH